MEELQEHLVPFLLTHAAVQARAMPTLHVLRVCALPPPSPATRPSFECTTKPTLCF